ncbi:T9SS type A sorting domain-containing protein [Autumnicola musiva]|uniref:T9SS type A sorting domain-containing protein n=1 Tax=Autumnicola musiva TaxID=3075589 RepID=A0ABU3DAY5_9FLAO|nr:T9SS type A sorting domain-containing protein [Zunongwangia sp. F117]MDT0678529.1 T9SS type A sorting domain-containing protein [Zunongwangia sp. F117]
MTLKASIPVSDCGPAMTFSKTITLGSTVRVILQSNVNSTEAKANITGQGINTTPTYTVLSSSGTSTLRMVNNNDGSYTLWGQGSTNTWSKRVRITIKSSCGTETKDITLTPPAPGGGGGCDYTLQSINVDTYALLPPPDCGSSLQTMAIISTSNSLTPENNVSNTFYIQVYDMNGIVVLETDEQIINLENLERGIYIIKAYWNDIEMTKKVAKL